MSWKVVYSAQARQDLRNIYEYIANELCVPDIAAEQTRRIMQNIRSLDEMPLRFRLYENEPWHSMGIHFLLKKRTIMAKTKLRKMLCDINSQECKKHLNGEMKLAELKSFPCK